MRQWIQSSLRRKLFILMLVSILIPLLFLGSFAYVISLRITEDKTKLVGMDTLRQMDGNLRFIIQDVENISLFLIGDRDIQEWLGSLDEVSSSSSNSSSSSGDIVGMITNLASSKPYISDITIYPSNESAELSTTSLYDSDLSSQLDMSAVKEKEWTGVYSVRDYAGAKNIITFIRPLRSIHNYNSLGWLTISLDEAVISEYWSQPQLGEGQGQVALVNDKGEVLSATNKSWLSKSFDTLYPGAIQGLSQAKSGSNTFGEGEAKQTILHYRQPDLNWMLIGTIPYDIYSSQNRYIWQLTLIAVALSVGLSTGLILFVVQWVTNPLRVLTRLLTRIDPERPLPIFPSASTDEIGMLGKSYNMLGKQIAILKEQLIRDGVRKKEADIRALQAQINPHFLYNTLSSIHWIALMDDEKRIADMVQALSDFLRISLNKGKDYYPVHQELAHIQNYAQIQSIRFPDQFELDFIIDAELNDKVMLKLLLQPLVENAMLHGIQKKQEKGTITVYLEKKEGLMCFLILDDGIGMTVERLDQVRSNLISTEDIPLEGLGGYGLRNVNERLILHYGPESQLNIQSRVNQGTRISFSIPIREG
ncbi:sensor histidine kinase [Paenibacillus monticola]|uniref:histidine kinase n=1 Tax=Paenibacillus monticola TaxID=2666075 RepID=A0A7X2L1W7_9BACL|nr:histidine kinase [Paenibacillus monticola]MRN52701.1 HAMP domain-containing protein [Paenibacillus monticola]